MICMSFLLPTSLMASDTELSPLQTPMNVKWQQFDILFNMGPDERWQS